MLRSDMKSFKFKFSTFVQTFLLLVAVVVTGCKEDEDDISPRVIVSQPFENQPFQSTDTIEATATITDNEQLTSVTLELLDLNFELVGKRESYFASGTSFNFGQFFPIDGELLESGDYYLAFRANDGNNIGSAFVKIRINAIPRQLDGVVAVTKANNQTSVYYREEDQSNFELKTSFFNDAVGAGLNYRQDILGIAGGEAGDAVFFDLEEYEVVATIPGFGNVGLPFYATLSFEDEIDRFFVAERDGLVRVLDENAAQLLAFNILKQHVPQEFFGNEEGFFVLEKEIDSPLHVLTHYTFQGLLLDVYQVNGPVRSLDSRNFNEKFVWVDAPGGFELRLLNLATGFLSLPYQRPDASLTDAVRVDQNVFILSTSEGLLRYNYSNGGVTNLNMSAPFGELYYDELSQLIYVVDGEEAIVYTTDGVELGAFSFPEEIVFIGFDYNR
jgi:hypothetical protein